MMKKLAALAFALVVARLLAPGSLSAQSPCGSPETAILWAGQTIDAGSCTVSNDATSIYVRYSTLDPWVITESHLDVATSLDAIPQHNGNPAPGQFPYSTVHNPGVTDFIYVIPIGGFQFGETLDVAAHAVVKAPGGGRGGGTQTGWAGDQQFPERN